MTRVPDKRAPAWDNQGQPRCFNCNTYAHLSKECTNPRKQREALKCFRCQKAGHMKKDCPDQQTLPKTTSTSTVSRLTTSVGDGKIIAIAERADIAPHVKDGYIMMFIYMPVVL
ncbi:lethal (3) 80Fj [Carabus blaptoides fortunei]